MDEQKGCQFCYYEYFDGKAYPCSMCIRGEERTDKFEPKGRQTKQTDCLDRYDRKTEPTISKMEQVDNDINVRSKDAPYIDIETGILHWCGWKYRRIYEDEPQTESSPKVPLKFPKSSQDEPQTDVYDYKGNGKWERSE